MISATVEEATKKSPLMLPIAAAAVLIMSGAGYFIKSKNPAGQTAEVMPSPTPEVIGMVSPTPQVEGAVAPPTEEMVYTPDDVAKHATPTDCWLAISGKVYNVTEFIASGKHPGKDNILKGCGKDATTLFATKGKEDGKPHSPTAESIAAQYLIGSLSEQ